MFVFSDYMQMKQDFNSQIKKLLTVNGKNKIEELDEPRRHQVMFLKQCQILLEDYNPKEKAEDVAVIRAKVFTGAIYVISNEIKDTYRLTDPLFHSGLFGGLQVTMGITSTTNIMDALSKRNILELLDQFMISYIHVGSKLRNDLRLDHPFVNIIDFDLNSFSQHLIDLRAAACSELKNEQHVKLALMEKQQAKQQLEQPNSSFFGRLWAGSSVKDIKDNQNIGSCLDSSAKKDDFPPLISGSSMGH